VKIIKKLIILALFCTILGSATIFGFYLYVKPELPNVDTLKDIRLQTPMQIYSRDNKLMAQFGEKRRIPVALDKIPQKLIDAFIATEDNRFYEHGGVDPIGIARALFKAVTTGSVRQGASTITQQLARNFFLTREKKLMRKIKEAFIAIHIEQLLTKDEILELYLNKIYLGYRAYGVAAAAQVYFGKSLDDLTLSEMAIIAGLPKAPSTMNPIYSIDRATTRRNVVLGRMLAEKYITQDEYDAAKTEAIVAHYHNTEIQLNAPYVAEQARQWMIKNYGDEAYTSGIKVYTTLDAKRQTQAQNAAINNLFNYDLRHGYRGPQAKLWTTQEQAFSRDKINDYLNKQPVYAPLYPAVVTQINDKEKTALIVMKGETKDITLDWEHIKWARPYKTDNRQGAVPKKISDVLSSGDQIWIRKVQDKKGTESWSLSQLPLANTAFVSLDTHDGAIQAMIGGFNFQYSKFNRATMSVRQVGSNIKPFIYSAALNSGLTLATPINDAPIIQWDKYKGEAWRPKNSPARYLGPLPLKRGLAQSKNVMAIRVLRSVGIDYAVDYLTRFGFKKESLPHVEALALGAVSLTPLELARGYAVFANGGYLVTPYYIDHITAPTGEILYQAYPKVACTQHCPSTLLPRDPVPQDEPSNQATQDSQAVTQGLSDATTNNINISPAPHPSQLNALDHDAPQYAPQVISSQNAFLTRELLQANIWGGGSWKYKTTWLGTGWRARVLKRHDIGGKTGTTNDAMDAWYTGYGPNMLTTVWVGFDNYEHQLGRTVYNANLSRQQVTGYESGGKTAQPAWVDFMRNALKSIKPQPMQIPEGIIQEKVDIRTGLLSNGQHPASTISEYFIKGTEPTEHDEDENTHLINGANGSIELF